MAKGKRGAGRRPAASSRSTAASRAASRGGAAASVNAEYLSDGSEDFLPLSGGRKDEQDSEDETAIMQQMGLEDAEYTASDEDGEESTEGGSAESDEGSDDDDQDDGKASGEQTSLYLIFPVCMHSRLPAPVRLEFRCSQLPTPASPSVHRRLWCCWGYLVALFFQITEHLQC